MPLTLSAQPTSTAFARNQAIVKLRADTDLSGTLYDARGVYSTLSAAMSDRLATGDTVTVEYTEPDGTSEVVTFEAVGTPDEINEVPDSTFSGSNSEYWNAVADAMGAHPRLAPFFTVQITGNLEITIQARSTDTGWDIELTTDSGYTVADFTATASTLPDNYRVLLEVYFEDSYRAGDYRLAAQMDGTPEAGTGYVYFDISSVLSAECRAARSEPLVPVWSTDAPALADNLRRYYFRYTEEYGTPPAAQD